DNGFQDFFISRIGPDTNTSAPPYEPYWGYFKNWLTSNNGGCQEQVGAGDEVLFAYSNYGQPLLQLAAPARAEKGQSFDVTVEQNDGAGNRTPALAASVETASTDASGHASLMFDDTGNHTFKATRSDAVRSNARTVCVYVPGSGDCGTQKASDPNSPTTPTTPTTTTTTPTDSATPSEGGAAVKDTTPPIVHVDSLEPGKTYTQGPRVLSGSVDESGGIAQVFLRLTASDGGDLTAASRCRWFSGKRGVFTHRVVPCARSRFFRVGTDGKFSYLLPARLGKGEYKLDVKVLDRAYNAGRTAVPFSVK
ncbi:MAG: hypothetical protein QOJ29_3734, partial [Thermoleophilaceae bacterium]|nr:hypothetical protein [Thermoleophilaceae bacterium]